MNDLFRAIAAEPYEARGILNSELALVIIMSRSLGVEAIVESGRARGQSTYLLAKYLPQVNVYSVELRDGPDERFARDRLMGLHNVTLFMGDGRALPDLCKELAPKRTAVLCDGPKGIAAVEIIEQCFHVRSVVVGFIHDMRRLDHGQPSPHRACAMTRLPKHRFSDDPGYAWASCMDADALAAGACGPEFEAVHGSYGPTIGAFANPY